MVAWSLPNISANHLFERLVTANIIFNLFTSFFAIHYYKISKYACKSTKIISEKGTKPSKCLQNKQIIEFFTILFLSLIIIKYERKSIYRTYRGEPDLNFYLYYQEDGRILKAETEHLSYVSHESIDFVYDDVNETISMSSNISCFLHFLRISMLFIFPFHIITSVV